MNTGKYCVISLVCSLAYEIVLPVIIIPHNFTFMPQDLALYVNCLPGRQHIKCQALYSLKKNKMSSAAAVNSILWVNIVILRTLVCVVDFIIPTYKNLICIRIQYRLQPSGCQSQSDRPRDPESWKHIYQIFTHMRFFCLHTTAFFILFMLVACFYIYFFSVYIYEPNHWVCTSLPLNICYCIVAMQTNCKLVLYAINNA